MSPTLTPSRSAVSAGIEASASTQPRARARGRTAGYALTAAIASFTLWAPLGASIEPHGAASAAAAYGGDSRHVSYEG